MSSGKGHIPIRTCISCHARRHKRDLLRMVRNANGMVVRDVDGKGEGRGAYVCSSKSCLRSLRASKRLQRAFRADGLVSLHPDFFRVIDHGGSCAWE